LLAR
jgi:hypothetical protein